MSTDEQRGPGSTNSPESPNGSNVPNSPKAPAASGGSPAPAASAPPAPNVQNPNARLRELLSIPERLRTDAQWDEIIEIEITMGPRKPSGNPGKSSNQSNQAQPRQNDNRQDRSDRKPPGMGKHSRKRRPGSGGGQQG